MTKTVEFYFDVGSPAAHLAFKRLPGICEAARAKVDFKPMLLGGVFGAPTFFVDGQMYWGQDRLDFVQEALEAQS